MQPWQHPPHKSSTYVTPPGPQNNPIIYYHSQQRQQRRPVKERSVVTMLATRRGVSLLALLQAPSGGNKSGKSPRLQSVNLSRRRLFTDSSLNKSGREDILSTFRANVHHSTWFQATGLMAKVHKYPYVSDGYNRVKHRPGWPSHLPFCPFLYSKLEVFPGSQGDGCQAARTITRLLFPCCFREQR